MPDMTIHKQLSGTLLCITITSSALFYDNSSTLFKYRVALTD
jgi:hypothetical protein